MLTSAQRILGVGVVVIFLGVWPGGSTGQVGLVQSSLVNEFIQSQQPVLSLSVSSPAADGSRQATGTLNDPVGHPIANAPIEFFLTIMSGSEAYYGEYTVSATVPAGATQAMVGFRVNRACDCAGTSDFTLYEVRYTEGTERTNRVPNGNFSQGLVNWGIGMSTGTVRLEPSDRGPGQILHVMATPAQTAILNGTPFPVTAGVTYTAAFVARVLPVSVGSGYFAVFFLDSSRGEVRRDKIPLAPARLSVGKTITDTNGAFQFTLSNLPQGQLLLEGNYPGDDARYLPAWASITLEPSR